VLADRRFAVRAGEFAAWSAGHDGGATAAVALERFAARSVGAD
jgi:hypothetical protein